MAKWIAAEKVRAGLRHAVVICPNVTGGTKERISQSKRARAGSLAIVDKWREIVSSGCLVCRYMSCRLSLVLSRCLFFVLFRFRIFAFIEAAALRSTVLRSSICMRPDSHNIQLPNNYYCLRPFFLLRNLLVSLVMSLFQSILYHYYRFSLCLYGDERTSHVFPFRMVFVCLVTTGWIFDISLLLLICRCCLKKNQNASRPSEHSPVRGENVKTFRWDHRL